MREYIFCSVIESPQIASRSPFFKTSPEGCGALTGLNFSSDGPFADGESGWADARLQVSSPNKKSILESSEIMRKRLFVVKWLASMIEPDAVGRQSYSFGVELSFDGLIGGIKDEN